MRCPSPLLGFARPRNLRSHPLQPVPSSARRLDGAAPDCWEAEVFGPNRGPGDETNAAGSCCRIGSTLNSAPRNPGGGIRSYVIAGKSRTPAGGSTGKKRTALPEGGWAMPRCDVCGNDYDKAFQVTKES